MFLLSTLRTCVQRASCFIHFPALTFRAIELKRAMEEENTRLLAAPVRWKQRFVTFRACFIYFTSCKRAGSGQEISQISAVISPLLFSLLFPLFLFSLSFNIQGERGTSFPRDRYRKRDTIWTRSERIRAKKQDKSGSSYFAFQIFG